jgi:phage terminase large subunit-like protein
MTTLAPPTRIEGFARECGITLEPFQKRIVKAVAGPERETVILLPRGQGKTTLMALIALHHLVLVENAAVYCAAASRNQATILFEAAQRFARRLDNEHIVHRHLELRWCVDPDEPKRFERHLRVLAADAPKLHGLTYSLAIVDELQAHAHDDVRDALSSGLHKRPGAKLVTISTAGQGADSPLGKLRTRAMGQPRVTRRGAVTDARGARLRMLEWSCSEDDDVDNARTVKRANPASWIRVDDIAAQRETLHEIPFRRYIANQWTERQGHWLPAGSWQKCIGEPRFSDGERVVVGVDVGGERSASAVAWINETLNVGVEIFYGTGGVIDCIDLVRELAGRYQVAEVAFDPWRFGQAAEELEREGLVMVKFPQTDQRMVPGSNRLHEAVTSGRITLPNNDELNQHAANAIAQHNRRGWRIGKPTKETHIDGIVALVMALDRLEDQPEPVRLLGWL